MGKLIDLTGQKFGRLTVIERAGSSKDKKAMWRCLCDCGEESIVIGKNLIRNHTKSCGCYHKEKISIVRKNLTGEKFGRLTVIERAENKNNRTTWLCKCECGNETIVEGFCLKHGTTKSCGCLRREYNTKHGSSHSRLYRIWSAMKGRCLNKNSYSYKWYGERGITICNEWIDDFQRFYDWAMLNGYSDDLSIDRIDVNGNYEPNNCRWVDIKTQANNTTRNNLITHNNETHTISEWSKILDISYDTLRSRISRNGWDIEKAFTIPTQTKYRRKK